MKYALAIISVVGFVISSGVSDAAAQDSALDALKALAPKAKWNQKSAVKADVTCDGVEDTVMLGYAKGYVWIGLVPGSAKDGPKIRPSAGMYPIGHGAQDAFCDRPTRIETSSHTCDSDYGALKNCKPIPECKDFAVIDSECDSFNFFWDDKQQSLSWWRD